MIQLPNGFSAVEVPEDAKDFCLHLREENQQVLVFSSEIQDPLNYGGDMITLPPGTWSIVGLAKDLTEKDWDKILGERDYAYNDFTNDEKLLATSTESGLSLIKSKGLKPETTLIIRKTE